jgi:photosystem II stability/assembly factor-like uncharacterized protein
MMTSRGFAASGQRLWRAVRPVRGSRPLTRAIVAAAGCVALLAVAAPSQGRSPAKQCSGRLVSTALGFAVCGQRLLLTHNERSWRDVTPPRLGYPIEDVVFLDVRHGWVVSGDCAAGAASVHRTHDGGRTWAWSSVRSTNCAAGSRLELFFLDPKHGWLVRIFENGNHHELDRTVDGGATWSASSTLLPLAGSVSFRTATKGWAARGDFRGRRALMMTQNGRTWRARMLRPPAGWKNAYLFADTPRFFGSERKRGVLPVDVVRGRRRAVAFYLTADAGRSWRVGAIRRVDFPIVRPHLPFVYFVPTSVADPSAWWVSINDRTAAVTTDAGRHWTVRRLPTAGRLSAVDGRHAWLSGSGLFTTTDGGRSWRPLTPG